MSAEIDAVLEEAATKLMDITGIFSDDTPLVTKAILVFEVGTIESGHAETYLSNYRTSDCAVWDIRGMLGDAIDSFSQSSADEQGDR